MKTYSQYINESTKTKEEQLLEEVVADNTKNVEHLLKDGADPNHISPHGSPLILSALGCYVKSRKTPKLYIIKLLIKYGADVNFVNKAGIYPLLYASASGDPSIVKFLIQNNAIFKHECYERSKKFATDTTEVQEYYKSYEGQKEILSHNLSAFPELQKVGLNPKIKEEYPDILKQTQWS